MKKVFSVILAFLLIAFLPSCKDGKEDTGLPTTNPAAQYCGTWEVYGIGTGDTTVTLEELEATGDYSFSDFKLVIKQGGKAYLYAEGESAWIDWSLTGDGIKIGIRSCTLQNGRICLPGESEDTVIYLEKTSNSQTVTKPDTATTGRPTGSPPDDDSEWKRAGKGCGAVVPEPSLPYRMNASSTYISATVNHATEDDFLEYVSRCIEAGFEGEIEEATSPTLLLMTTDGNGHRLQVFFYEDRQEISIYADNGGNW